MPAPIEPLSTSILATMYFGDVVFAVSGALTAARHRMDVLGFVMIGTITGIGGGTTRDLLLGRTVWWTQNPHELILCVVASLATFFWITTDISRRRAMVWSDALGLAAFGVVGCYIALQFGAPFIVAVFMGVVTATGGGVIRDILTNTQPATRRPPETPATRPCPPAARDRSATHRSARRRGRPWRRVGRKESWAACW